MYDRLRRGLDASSNPEAKKLLADPDALVGKIKEYLVSQGLPEDPSSLHMLTEEQAQGLLEHLDLGDTKAATKVVNEALINHVIEVIANLTGIIGFPQTKELLDQLSNRLTKHISGECTCEEDH